MAAAAVSRGWPRPADERVGQARADARRRRPGRAGVEDQHPEVRVVLGGEAVEDLVEPRPRLVGDDDRHDGRCGAAGAVHEPSRVVVGPRAGTVMAMAEAAGDDLFSQVSAVASDALYVAVGLRACSASSASRCGAASWRRSCRRRSPSVLRAAGERLGAAVADVRQLVK